MRLARWILLLPCAAASGYLAYFVGGFVNNLSILLYSGRPPSGWVAIFVDTAAHMYMGAASTYIGMRIAPRHRKAVAASITGLWLLLAGASILATILGGMYAAITPTIGVVVGSVGLTISVFRNELTL